MRDEYLKKDVKVVYASEFKDASSKLKKKNSETFERLLAQVEKIIREPEFGKPLRYSLRNRRRLRIGSFVLIYEFYNNEIRFLDFDHHDRIYKKYI